MTYHHCLHCAFLKALNGFQEKGAHKSRDMQFFLQNVKNEIFKIFKMFKNNMKFTRTASRINSKINSFVTIVGHYYGVITESLFTFRKNVLFASMKALQKWWRFFFVSLCYILKALTVLLVLKIFKFLWWLFDQVKNPGLIRKIRLTSKFMKS